MVKKKIDWLKIIRDKAKKKILFSYHATVQMNLEDRLITTDEVREVISKGKLIESRLNDPRGKTFLLNGKTKVGRYLHIVCSPKENFLIVVTTYVPNQTEWINNFSIRIKS